MTRLSHRAGRPRARHRSDGDRGAVIVEFAMVAVLLVTILAGAFDYGSAWRVGLAANEAARAGARVGSGQGNVKTADFSLLTSMRSALDSSGELANVTRVVLFKAATTAGTIPSTCKTSNGSGQLCNIFTGDQFRSLPTSSGGTNLTSTGCINNSTTKNWCPTTRTVVQLTADYIGVWVQVEYKYFFPLLGNKLLVERTAVMRLEPKDT